MFTVPALDFSRGTPRRKWLDIGESFVSPGKLIDVRDANGKGEGKNDFTEKIKSSVVEASNDGGTVFLADNTHPIYSTIRIDSNNVNLIGQSWRSILSSSENITMIAIGHYSWQGLDDFKASDFRYSNSVQNMTIMNNSPKKENTFGLELWGSAQGVYKNLHIQGCRVGLAVKPVSGWCRIGNLLIDGEGLEDAVKIVGEGAGGNYNSTGLIFYNLQAVNFTGTGFSAIGPVFGDIVGSNFIFYGGSKDAIGLLLDSTGNQFYANKIQIHGLDMDGTATSSIRARGVSQLQVYGYTKSGIFANEVDIQGGAYNRIVGPGEEWITNRLGVTRRITINDKGDGWVFEP